MRELDAILDAWRVLPPQGQPAVLSTVVHVVASAYRRPGARMLILPDGRRIGSISGGCLEGDVSKKAWWFTENGRPSLRVYDTSSDEDAVWEFGLGCNGIIEVLLERVDAPDACAALEFLDHCRQARRESVVAVVVRSAAGSPYEPGQRLHSTREGAQGGALLPHASRLAPFVEEAFSTRRSLLARLPEAEVFVEYTAPPTPLVIFGAGHDAMPLARIAARLGFRVTVADGRPAYATRDRFPSADRIVVMRPGRLLDGIGITPETAVVMMTHNFPQDALLLPDVLRSRPFYLGLLGPARRTEKLFAQLGLNRAAVDVHAPVGLDIGAETPDAIALSIAAEIQAVLAGRSGLMLRHRRGPIHAPVPESGDECLLPPARTELIACEINSEAAA
jgi:xanthine dehydrogenase accessory factor